MQTTLLWVIVCVAGLTVWQRVTYGLLLNN